MNLRYSQLAHLTQFSNEKMVNLIKTKLAESENAAGALVFDDKVIVLDEETNDLYSVDYDIDNRALNLKEWEKINVIPDNQSYLEELAEDYFDPTEDPNIRVKDLVEAFKLKNSEEPFKRLVNKAATEKKSIVESNSRIKSLKKLREAREEFLDDIEEVVEDEKVKTIYNSVNENSPTQNTISRIDFQHPLSVSLFEESSDKVISLSEGKKQKKNAQVIRKKVNNLWTSQSFKEDVQEMVQTLTESDNPEKVVENFINNHKELLVLEESELEDLMLKTTLMLDESKYADQVTQTIKDYYNREDVQEARRDYLERNMITEEGEGDASGGFEASTDDEEEAPRFGDEEEPEEGEAKGGDAEEGKSKKKSAKKDKESTIDEDSINKLLKVLNKIKDSLEEKTMERKYIESFVQSLEDAKVGSMSEGKLKEIMDFLNSIYQEAQESDQEEE